MSELKGEHDFNVPNTITAVRIGGAVVESGLYAATGKIDHFVKIGGYFSLDVIDGPVARTLDQETELGADLDPVGDKITVAGMALSAGIRRTIDAPVAVAVGTVNALNITATLLARQEGVTLEVGKIGKISQFLMNSGVGINVLGNHYRRNGETSRQRLAGHVMRFAGGALAIGSAATLGTDASAQYWGVVKSIYSKPVSQPFPNRYEQPMFPSYAQSTVQ